MGKLVVAFVSLLVITACEVSVKDGKVPNQYLSEAKKYSGIYHGEFEGQQKDLKLDILKDGTVVLAISDLRGGSELVASCQSKIGKLISADVNKKNKTVNGISFQFNGQSCEIEGTTLDLKLESDKALSISLVKSYRTTYSPGETDCSDGANGTIHCHHGPGEVLREPSVVLTGSFSK